MTGSRASAAPSGRPWAPVAGKYGFRLNDYYLDLIDWSDPGDPIRQSVIPRGEELEDYGALNASDEGANTVVEHARIVRIGSKMLAFDPCRLRRDAALQRVLQDHAPAPAHLT